MPHGFECDRCNEFVEQHGKFTRDVHTELGNSGLEEVRIDNPQLQSSDGGGIEHYTLCESCRQYIIKEIETFGN